jgi:DNA invertase Pin-like site-specific DNA recombinase
MIQESIFADFKRNDFEITSVMEPDLCSNDPTRVLLRQMMGVFSEYERKMIVEKLRGARQRAKAANPDYQEGRKPYGDRPGEPETIARILALKAKGCSLLKIADTLNAEGRKPRSGNRWWATSVRNVIVRSEEGA